MNLNELRDKAFATATAKGFHDKEYSNEHWLMLVITELSEAVEADRKDKRSGNEFFKFSSLPFNRAYDMHIKGTSDEEIADVIIRLLDLAGLRDVDIVIDENKFKETSDDFNRFTFIEGILLINQLICGASLKSVPLKEWIPNIIGIIFGFAEHENINLLWHIEQKMKYNETRKPLHGKSY